MVLWRKKAQFDDGTGTLDALAQAVSQRLGAAAPVNRKSAGRLYERLLREQFEDPDLILTNAGMWAAGRIAA